MSPTFSSFAVAGAGVIGTPIVEALLLKGVKVIALTRTTSKKTFPTGTIVEPVDYESQDSIQAALKKHEVEVVISTMNFPGMAYQNRIADAAKAAGVKLFVPSEFGMPTVGGTEGMVGLKETFVQYLKSIGLPYARVFVGFFTRQVPWLIGYEANGKINILGKGESPVSFTAEDDIAGFVAHVLTEQPAEVSRNKVLRIQGDRYTFKELAPLFKTEAVHVDKVPGREPELNAMLHHEIEKGMGSTGWDNALGREGEEPAGSSNHLWPGHHWKTVKEVHNL